MTFKSWILTSEKKDQVARIGVRGGVRWFGQCPKENVFFSLMSSLIQASQRLYKIRQPTTSSYNFQPPHGRHGHHSPHGQGCHGGQFNAVSCGYALINAHKPKCICAYEKFGTFWMTSWIVVSYPARKYISYILQWSSMITTSREHRNIVQFNVLHESPWQSWNKGGLQQTKGLGRRHAKSVNITTSALFVSKNWTKMCTKTPQISIEMPKSSLKPHKLG